MKLDPLHGLTPPEPVEARDPMPVDRAMAWSEGHTAGYDEARAALATSPDDQHLTVDDDGPGDYTRATDPRDNGRNER